MFHCYVGISRTLGFFWCSIVTLVSRSRLVFLGVPLLCWYLAHAWFFLVFHCYVGISRTLGFSWCFTVMLVSRARLVFFGIPLCWYLAHAWFFLVFHCYVGISRMLVFFGCSIVMLVSRARLVFFGFPLLCWYLAHTWFFLVFHCYVGISRTLSFPWCFTDFFSIDFAGFKVSILCTLNFPCCAFVTLLSRPIVSLVFFNTFKWCPMLIIAFRRLFVVIFTFA